MSPKIKEPELLYVMAGTAGHVDHGKTALVRLLTGCETDKLKEEKQRGLTIDLGFAPCRIQGNKVIGIVDVPGHIDFIKNMVAGASSIDLLLLVVAADDSIMPQTREHLNIVKLLRTPEVIVVITKTDLVEPDMLELVIEETTEYMAESGFPDVPICPVSNITLDGISNLRKVIDDAVDRLETVRDNRAFRMNVERVFSVKGFGTVITGIPISGTVKVGDNLELLPDNGVKRVRTLQNFKMENEISHANICTALNISDTDAEKVHRGMVLAEPGIYNPISNPIVSFTNIEHRPIKHNTEVRFHCGTATVSAKVMLINSKDILHGEKGFAQLKLSEPVVLAAGDKFIMRMLSPSITIAGGLVLSTQSYKLKRNSTDLVERLKMADKVAEKRDFFASELLSGVTFFINKDDMAVLTKAKPEDIKNIIDDKIQNDELVKITSGTYLINLRVNELTYNVIRKLKRFHEKSKYSWGMDPKYLCKLLNLTVAAAPKLAEILAKQDGITIKHGKLSLEDFKPDISKRLMTVKNNLVHSMRKGDNKAPARTNLINDLGIKEDEMKFIIKVLIEEDTIIVIGKHIMLIPDYEVAFETVKNIYKEKGVIEIKTFRDKTGFGRNFAVNFLEFLDGKGLTKRRGESRILV